MKSALVQILPSTFYVLVAQLVRGSLAILQAEAEYEAHTHNSYRVMVLT